MQNFIAVLPKEEKDFVITLLKTNGQSNTPYGCDVSGQKLGRGAKTWANFKFKKLIYLTFVIRVSVIFGCQCVEHIGCFTASLIQID